MNYLFTQFSRHFIAILVILNLLIFGQSVKHQLVWDDHAFINNQDHGRFATLRSIVDGSFPVPDTGSYRPVRNAVYALTLPLFKDNSVYHHGFILALQMISSLQVFFLLRSSAGKSAAQWGALIFAAHPIHTESINWVTAGYDLLFIIFYLGALLAHYSYQSGQIKHRRWAYLFGLLALFSNEIALTLPAVIMLTDYYFYRLSPSRPENRLTYGLYWLLAGFYWLVRMIFITQNPFSTTVYPGIIKNFFLGAYLFGQYLLQLFAPTQLSVDRLFFPGLTGLYSLNHNLTLPPPVFPPNLGVILSFLFSLVWLILTLFALRKKSLFALPLLWIPLSLLPVLRLVPLPAIYSERYAYLASVGFVLLLAFLFKSLSRFPAAKIFLGTIFSLYFTYFSLLSFRRSQDWRDDYTLWTKTYAQNPQSATAVSSLGVQYFILGDLENSLKYHRLSVTLNPYVSSYQQNYVSLLARLSQWDEIIAFVELIQKTDAKNVNLYTILASTYDAKGDYQQAMANYQKAYDLSPAYSPGRQEIEKLVDLLDRKYQVVDQ